MFMKLGMQHRGLNLYKIYMNDDVNLHLFNVKVKVACVAFVFEWGNVLQSHLMEKLNQKNNNKKKQTNK